MIILDSLSFCSFSVQRYNFSFAVANLFHLFLLLVFIYFQINFPFLCDYWNKYVSKLRREKEEATQNAKVKEKLAIAKKLLSLELPHLQIMQATGLTKEQIDSLKK